MDPVHVQEDMETPEHKPELPTIKAEGRTRVQSKADEYEIACGRLWKDYQSCLKVRHVLQHNIDVN